MSYKVLRFFANPDIPSQVVKTGLTLEEAQEHCKNPETSSRTCTNRLGKHRTQVAGHWFEGFTEER